jgi:hypothetical protein
VAPGGGESAACPAAIGVSSPDGAGGFDITRVAGPAALAAAATGGRATMGVARGA